MPESTTATVTPAPDDGRVQFMEGNRLLGTAPIDTAAKELRDGLNRCPKCGSTEVRHRPGSDRLICLYCRHEWAATRVEEAIRHSERQDFDLAALVRTDEAARWAAPAPLPTALASSLSDFGGSNLGAAGSLSLR